MDLVRRLLDKLESERICQETYFTALATLRLRDRITSADLREGKYLASLSIGQMQRKAVA